MDSPAPALRSIGQIAVPVRDLDRATGFYGDVLGLPMLFRIPSASFFHCGEVRLMLALPEAPEQDHPASILYFRTNDLAAARAAMLARAVRFEDEPHLVARMPDHELWMTFFRDSEANLMALMSEVR